MRINVVLVSDDPGYSQKVLSEISRIKHDISVTQVEWASVQGEPDVQTLADTNVHAPTIMMLDFGFIRRACEEVLERMVALRRQMAVECLAMRPPADDMLRKHLARWGVLLFDLSPAPFAMAGALH